MPASGAGRAFQIKSNHTSSPRGQSPCVNIKNVGIGFREVAHDLTAILWKITTQIAAGHDGPCVVNDKGLEWLAAWTDARFVSILLHSITSVGAIFIKVHASWRKVQDHRIQMCNATRQVSRCE
jgi:hypothetical protein